MNETDGAVFSSNSDEWKTPDEVFKTLDAEFHFDYDAACIPENCKTNYGIFRDEMNALETAWTWLPLPVGCARKFFLNPPYSKIGAFMKKAYEESLKGAIVVCLIPSRTDTRYWHDYVMKAHEIRFIIGRVSFYGRIKDPGQPKDTPKDKIKYTMGWAPAPFPSCVVIFDLQKYDKNNDPLMKVMIQGKSKNKEANKITKTHSKAKGLK